MRQVLGILLAIVGVAYIVFHGFHFTSHEQILGIGPIQATTSTRQELIPYSPLLGGVIIAGGIMLFVAGLARREI
jgi:drug/metabolite transporter (DMT)-like permease